MCFAHDSFDETRTHERGMHVISSLKSSNETDMIDGFFFNLIRGDTKCVGKRWKAESIKIRFRHTKREVFV